MGWGLFFLFLFVVAVIEKITTSDTNENSFVEKDNTKKWVLANPEYRALKANNDKLAKKTKKLLVISALLPFPFSK